MKIWKQRLYEKYVSSGHAARGVRRNPQPLQTRGSESIPLRSLILFGNTFPETAKLK
jgi:hypothetical protein